MVVLIADAPPHGIGKCRDGEFCFFPSLFFEKKGVPLRVEMCMHLSVWKSGFDDGSPDGNDPLVLARCQWLLAESLWYVRPFSCLVPVL
jgi:hypothetical protein